MITPSHIVGTPDLLVEIASPGAVGYDRRAKQDAYARAGVPEYWLADPTARTVEVLQLEQDVYRSLGVFRGRHCCRRAWWQVYPSTSRSSSPDATSARFHARKFSTCRCR